MNNIILIKKVSIWIFVLPVIVLNLCLFVSTNYHLFENTIFVVDQIGRTSFTIPYIDGGVSISRTARTYPAYLIFKPGMIITAFLLIKYWSANNNLFQTINNIENRKNFRFFYFGTISAIFLIAHSIFLGIHFENDLYKFFRRFVLLGFILFELAAQTLLIMQLLKVKKLISNNINNNILTLKIILVALLVIVALLSVPILITSGHVHFKHMLEWNYFIGILIFYLLTFLFWRKNKTQVHG